MPLTTTPENWRWEGRLGGRHNSLKIGKVLAVTKATITQGWMWVGPENLQAITYLAVWPRTSERTLAAKRALAAWPAKFN